MESIPLALRQDHFALLTSGSTGLPKIVLGRKRSAEDLAVVIGDSQRCQDAESVVVALPLSYSFAFVNQFVWATTCEKKIVRTSGLRNTSELTTAWRTARSSMVCLAGPQARLVLQLLGKESYPEVRSLNFAGGMFPQEHLGALSEMFPSAHITNNYGCAEALPRLTSRGAADSPVAANIGVPLPGVELMSDESGLFFRSEYGAVAVLTEGDTWAMVEEEAWIATGDKAFEAGDGSWVLEGRASEVFKRHGEKVSALQVLRALQAVWTGEVATYHESDSYGEDGFVLVMAPTPTQEDLRTILRVLRDDFRRAHWPLRIEGVAALPRLPSGKVDLMQLRGEATLNSIWRQRV